MLLNELVVKIQITLSLPCLMITLVTVNNLLWLKFSVLLANYHLQSPSSKIPAYSQNDLLFFKNSPKSF